MLRALGKAAQTVAEIHLVGIVQIAEQARPLPVGTQHVGKGLVAVVREIVGRRVVLLVAVVVAIVQLQKQPLGTSLPPLAPASGPFFFLWRTFLGLGRPEGLGIGGSQRIAEVVGGRSRVAVGLISGIVALHVRSLIEPHGREIGIAVAAVAIVRVAADGQVAPPRTKTTKQLQLRAQVFVAAVAQRLVLPIVNNQTQPVHLGAALVAQRVGHIVERIGVERGRGRERAAVVGRKTHVRTHRQRRNRI